MKKVTIEILFLTVMLLFSVRLSHAREQDQAGLLFSAAVKFGNLLFLSGLLGTVLKTGEFVSPEVGQQTS